MFETPFRPNRRNAMALLASSLGLAGCGGKSYAWNQKLTVEVHTPAGVKVGSSVVGIKVSSGQFGLSQTAASYRVRGEATVVEVAPGKFLFALLGERSTKELATHTWDDQLSRNADEAWAKTEVLREKRQVPRKEYPLLVTFRDITDPKSVVEVKPDRLADVFGAGFGLRAITLEITDEEVTGGEVEKLLPWSRKLVGSIGKDMQIPYSHVLNKINDGSFFRG